MYAKIVTLLALLLGSLSGAAVASQSAAGEHSTRTHTSVESVQFHVSQDAANPSDPRPETEDPSRPERPEEESDFVAPLGCHTTDGTINPEVEAFASQLGLSYDSVLAWYCSGYSLETVQVIYNMSVMAGVSIDQIYEMRVVTGLTWDQIIQELGITFPRGEEPVLPDVPRPTR
jgi:hypothetical protein